MENDFFDSGSGPYQIFFRAKRGKGLAISCIHSWEKRALYQKRLAPRSFTLVSVLIRFIKEMLPSLSCLLVQRVHVTGGSHGPQVDLPTHARDPSHHHHCQVRGQPGRTQGEECTRHEGKPLAEVFLFKQLISW